MNRLIIKLLFDLNLGPILSSFYQKNQTIVRVPAHFNNCTTATDMVGYQIGSDIKPSRYTVRQN
jgi:hypothetical protein